MSASESENSAVSIEDAEDTEYAEDSIELDNVQDLDADSDDADDTTVDTALDTTTDPAAPVTSITIVVIKDENRVTSSVMSKYEMTECVSIRATQIEKYNNCMVDTTGLTSPIEMAKRELMMRKSPLVLRRFVGERVRANGQVDQCYEYWRPAEMTFATAL